jgi:hypothetical protein
MREIYLGDSFDIVKRFWAESLRPVAPLYAHPRFVPAAIRTPYTAVTAIPVLDPDRLPEGRFGLLLDPHTGIPLPAESPAEPSGSHAPLAFIVAVNGALRPAYMICFDQSYHRRHELTKPEQLERKRAFLQTRGIGSFYYHSHAPFLFMAERAESLAAVRDRLVALGVPQERFAPRSNRRAGRST